jgi:hypothetical protein
MRLNKQQGIRVAPEHHDRGGRIDPRGPQRRDRDTEKPHFLARRRLHPSGRHQDPRGFESLEVALEGLDRDPVVLRQAVGARGHRTVGRGERQVDDVESLPGSFHERAGIVDHHRDPGVVVDAPSFTTDHIDDRTVRLDRRHRRSPACESDQHVETTARLEDQRVGVGPQQPWQNGEHVACERGVFGCGARDRAEIVTIERDAALSRRNPGVREAQPGE